MGIEVAMTVAEIGTITAEQLRFMMIYETEPTEKLKELLTHGIHKVSVVEMGENSRRISTQVAAGPSCIVPSSWA